MLIQDYDPLPETNTVLRCRRGWADTGGLPLTRVRTPPGISTICSTIRSEIRSSEESNAVQLCPG